MSLSVRSATESERADKVDRPLRSGDANNNAASPPGFNIEQGTARSTRALPCREREFAVHGPLLRKLRPSVAE
jgi:hypothetical protein